MAKMSNTGRRLTRPSLIKALLVSGAVLALVLAACSAADRAGGAPAADSGANGSLTGDTSGTPSAPPGEPSPGHDDRAVAAQSHRQIALLAGEAAIVGTLVWENGQPLLDTPSGRVRLTLLTPAPPPLGGGAGDAAPSDGAPNARPASLQVVAVGKWRIEQGQLVLAVRYLVPAPSPIILEPGGGPPPPPVVTPPPEGAAILTGQVHIGPLCPVEPCRNPTPDVYSSRSLVLQPQVGEPVIVPLQSDGAFKAAVAPGTYQVTLTNCGFLGCKAALPKTVTIRAGQVTTLEITIDTGIR